MKDSRKIQVEINGVIFERMIETRMTLSDFIRHECGLTGTHVGCEHGVCGACTIHLNGQAIRSCIMYAVQAHGQKVTTVEGLSQPDGTLHPLQQAFKNQNGLQCGFCTPGMLMTCTAYLEEKSDPTEQEIREVISGNICRCTGYQGIVNATLEIANNKSTNGGA
ncbi:MAG: (2Fe-2S)-binding protein [Betaproteobacteria bacterium]|jgi:carbon-monoxide dehydrogenase small subunit|nr:(2Fe-2S)-binding protein [Betaproteobacteria bacterium]